LAPRYENAAGTAAPGDPAVGACSISKVPVMKSSSYLMILLGLTALLGPAKSAVANGGHVHLLGGIFLLLLGGLVFVTGIGVVFYLLLRPNPDASNPDDDDIDDDEDIY
jgi:hypothetical protein